MRLDVGFDKRAVLFMESGPSDVESRLAAEARPLDLKERRKADIESVLPAI